MTRRTLLLALAAARFAAGKSHITRAKVGAITDEMGKTQEDALALAGEYRIQLVELRNIPGRGKEFASLSEPELRGYTAGLDVAKLKVSFLHVSALQPNTLSSANVLGARRVVLTKPDPAALAQFRPAFDKARVGLLAADSPELAAARIRVDIWDNRNWRAYFEKLERDNFQGDISLATTPEKAEESMKELMHFIGEL